MTSSSRSIQSVPTIAISTIYLIFASSMPVTLQMFQGYDDGLYINLADRILKGEWLGPYDQMTLVKGFTFPLFLAVNNLTGLPVNLGQAAFYLFSCIVFAQTVAALYQRRTLVYIFVLVALLLTPSVYMYLDRVIRDFFYSSISLLTIALWIKVYVSSTTRISILQSVIAGALLFLFWMTREEAIWIVPTLLLITVCSIACVAPGQRRVALKTNMLKSLTVLLSLLVCALVAKTANYQTYGSATLLEMTDGDFQSAMRQLQRVGAPYSRPYVPVPKEARMAIYDVSPHFASIRDHLEGTPNQATCDLLPDTCGDIAGGWFMWALRDAVAKTGHHSSPTEAASFYRTLADEVSAACDEGLLICSSFMMPLIPHIPSQQWTLLGNRIVSSLGLLQYSEPFSIQPPASTEHELNSSAMVVLNFPPTVRTDGSFAMSDARGVIYELWRWTITRAASVAYFLIIFAVISLVVTVIGDRRWLQKPVNYVIWGLMVGIVIRTFIMILVDISSFPTIYYPRFSTTGVLVMAASILSVFQAISVLTESWSRRHASRL
jgi:hypothetical protein